MNQYTPLKNFSYSIIDNGIQLNGYKGTDITINIPSTYKIENQEYIVKSIGKYCFYHNLDIEEVILPDTIKKIGESAFFGCINLNKINLSNIETICNHVFGSCGKLNSIELTSLKNIENNAFRYTNVELNDFENKYIKIENNNIYQKKTKNNKIKYVLNNCYQKEDTLVIKEDGILDIVINDNIKNIIIEGITTQNWYIQSDKIDHLIILGKINSNNDIHIQGNIENLYVSDQTNIFNLEGSTIKNKLWNTKDIGIKNIIYKKDINELLEEGYTFKQINLITKGYNKNILLSNINLNTSEDILRNIINNFNCDNIELYKLLELLNKENITLEDQLKIQKIIDKKANKDNIKEDNNLER